MTEAEDHARLEKLAYCGHDREMTAEQQIAHNALSPLERLVNECDSYKVTCPECRNWLTQLETAYELGFTARVQQGAQEKADEPLPESLAASLALFRENPTQWWEEWQRRHDFKVRLIQRAEAAEAHAAALAPYCQHRKECQRHVTREETHVDGELVASRLEIQECTCGLGELLRQSGAERPKQEGPRFASGRLIDELTAAALEKCERQSPHGLV